jgi:predicted nuclease of predicted toxin-antitoxin system
MRFLLDANMPRRSGAALHNLGHECIDARDVALGGAPDSQVAAYAKAHALALITRDWDFADVRNYPPNDYQGIVVLNLPDDATAQTITQTLTAFVSQKSFLSTLPGRLAIVELGRVRFRPA